MKKLLLLLLTLLTIGSIYSQENQTEQDTIFYETEQEALLEQEAFIEMEEQFSQDLLLAELTAYPFIKFIADTFAFDLKTSLLTTFFARFDSVIQTKTGNINIVHIGGSHIQAGTFPHRIRKNILLTYPHLIAQRGMIFPYSVAPKCNNPYDYKIEKTGDFSLVRNVYKEHAKPLGATGIAVYTSDTGATIKVKMNTPEFSFPTNSVILLGAADSGNPFPTIWIDDYEYFPVTIDTNQRMYTYQPEGITDSFLINLNIAHGDTFTINGIFLADNSFGITYHSLGVNGASVASFLRCENFERELPLLNPDLVIFNLGINDASGPDFNPEEFKNQYLKLAELFTKTNPQCAFIFVTNNDSYKRIKKGKYAVNKNGTIVKKAMYDLASLTQGAVFDQFEIMGGLSSMEKWRVNKLAQYDRVHFTVAGYTLMGDLFFRAFMEAKTKCDNYNNNND